MRIDSWPTVAAILLSTLAVPYTAHAWGREGHVIVAEVAAMHLTPQARIGVHRLLDLEPDPKHRTLAHAAIWPDLIKNPRHPQHKQYAFARKLHYVNMPPNADGYDRRRDCPDGKCVIEATRTYCEKIKNDPDPQQRLVALKFLVHFVGDIHQPLHVGYKHDRGGNDVSVDFFGQRTNLHRVWDTMILRRDRATGSDRTSFNQTSKAIRSVYASVMKWAAACRGISREHRATMGISKSPCRPHGVPTPRTRDDSAMAEQVQTLT